MQPLPKTFQKVPPPPSFPLPFPAGKIEGRGGKAAFFMLLLYDAFRRGKRDPLLLQEKNITKWKNGIGRILLEKVYLKKVYCHLGTN